MNCDELLSAAVSKITDIVAEVLYNDPHRWSKRPCSTCKTITSLIGKPFGCDRFRLEKENERFQNR